MRSDDDAFYAALAHRLDVSRGDDKLADISAKTGLSGETVRRYMHARPMKANFLASFCKAYGINPAWALYGEGPQYTRDVPAHEVEAADTENLAVELIHRLERTTKMLSTAMERRRLAQENGRTLAIGRGDAHAPSDPRRAES